MEVMGNGWYHQRCHGSVSAAQGVLMVGFGISSPSSRPVIKVHIYHGTISISGSPELFHSGKIAYRNISQSLNAILLFMIPVHMSLISWDRARFAFVHKRLDPTTGLSDDGWTRFCQWERCRDWPPQSCKMMRCIDCDGSIYSISGSSRAFVSLRKLRVMMARSLCMQCNHTFAVELDLSLNVISMPSLMGCANGEMIFSRTQRIVISRWI